MDNKFKKESNPASGLKEESGIYESSLSVNESARLPGYSRQYIYRLVKCGTLKSFTDNRSQILIDPKVLLRWFASQDVTPYCPIGYESISLKEFIRYTNMSRSWILGFVKRYKIPSFYIYKYRRFCKRSVETAWDNERLGLKNWLTPDEAVIYSGIDSCILYQAIAERDIRIKRMGQRLLINKSDLLNLSGM